MISVSRVILAIVCVAAAVVCHGQDVDRGKKYSYTCDGVPARLEAGLVCGQKRVYERYRQTPLRPRQPWERAVYVSFRGVPYANPPLGSLRFQKLEPTAPWEGYLDASVEGPVCPQHDYLFNMLTHPHGTSEDCITANLHVPWHAFHLAQQREKDPRLNNYKGVPILVFIHGGGFAFGSGDSDLYGPEFMVDQGIMVVTFNYRLGPMGFLSLNSPEIPGNNGLRDQVTLLQWVQRNCGALGGDVTSVTLAGQSAGAASAHLLTLSRAAVGLFHKAFLMSGAGVRSFFSTSPAYADLMAKSFLTLLGINSTNTEDIHRLLINMPLDDLMTAHNILLDQNGLMVFAPVVESEFDGVTRIIDDDPDILLEQARGKDIPLLVQFTTKEVEIFKRRLEEINIVGLIARSPEILIPPALLFSREPAKLTDKMYAIQEAYFSKNESVLDNFIAYSTDAHFKYPAIHLVKKRIKTGGKTYLYEFDYEGIFRIMERPGYEFSGAVHTEDIFYLFKANSKAAVDQRLVDSSKDGEMQRKMQCWLAKFIEFNHTDPLNSRFTIRGPASKSDYLLGVKTKPNHEIDVDMLPADLRDLTKYFDLLYE